MNNFVFLLRGLTFLVIGGIISGCPVESGVTSTLKDVSVPSQNLIEPLLLKKVMIDGFTIDRLYFLLDNEHIMVIQGYKGASFIDLKDENILHSYLVKEIHAASEQIFHQDQYLLLQGRGIVYLWEIASGKLLQSWRDPDINAKATAVSQSGRTIFTAQYVRQLQDETASWEKGPVRTLFSINAHAILSAATISPNEDFLATGGTWDNYTTLWDLHTGKRMSLWQMDQHVRTLSFSLDNRYLYAGTYNKLIVYDVVTQAKVSEISHPVGSGAEYLANQDAMLVVSDEGEIQLITPTGKQLWYYQAGQEVKDWNHYPQRDLAVRLANGEIVILDVKSGQVRLRFQSPFQVMGPLAVSQDGKWLTVAMFLEKEEKWGIALWQLPKKGNSGK